MPPGLQADWRPQRPPARHPAQSRDQAMFFRNNFLPLPRCPLSSCLAVSKYSWSSESPAVSKDELNRVLQLSAAGRKRSPAEVYVASIEINMGVAGLQAQRAVLAGIKFHNAAQIEHKIRGTAETFLAGLRDGA